MARVGKDVVENTTNPVSDKENIKEDIVKQLQEQINAMQKELEKLQKEKTVSQDFVTVNSNYVNDKDELKLEDDIPVISQCVGTLTLSTDGKGEGSIYRFSEFGDIQDIPWGDLKEICKNMKSLAQKGAFYIANEKAVEKARLKTFYKQMLKNEDILHLFEKDAKTIIELYKLANDFQKETIIDLIVNKKLNGESVDGNVLIELSKLSGKDLSEI